MSSRTLEYKFVRLNVGWTNKAEKRYHDVIQEHAGAGWRLVQIFAPGIGIDAAPKYYEAIFERPVPRAARPAEE